jgi:phosphoribosylanthranilate isomerase
MLKQLKELEDIGIDFAGFIFYDKSPRFALKSGLTPDILKKEKLRINRVGVFVNESSEKVLKTVHEWKLDLVQLHGDESPRYCEMISNHVNTIKAFRISKNDNISYKTHPFKETADLYLFDTFGQQFGGTGEKFDWQLLTQSSVNKPYFLSGGITLDDVSSLAAFAKEVPNLFSLDINSKFELSPGNKDMNKIKQFAEKVKTNQ